MRLDMQGGVPMPLSDNVVVTPPVDSSSTDCGCVRLGTDTNLFHERSHFQLAEVEFVSPVISSIEKTWNTIQII